MAEKDKDVCHIPGTEVPESGIYINPDTGEKTTCVKGEPFPPTSGKGQCWQLETPTHSEDE